MKVVVKISGKFISPIDKPLVREYAKTLDQIIEEGHELFVVVGGGSIARKYIDLVNSNNFLKDLIGIEASRLNARALAYTMKHSIKRIPESIDDLLKLYSLNFRKAIISGGLQPGQSTNAVSLLIAELVGAELVVNATTVDALYDKPPSDPTAKKLLKVSYDEALRILSSTQWKQEPGRYELFDLLSLHIAKRSKIPIAIVNGSDPLNVYNAIVKGYYGSLITNELSKEL
ncbi:UMP kinase [Ignicoccus islandicus]|nr:UMP kinase [Ignicoccus islandicus]